MRSPFLLIPTVLLASLTTCGRETARDLAPGEEAGEGRRIACEDLRGSTGYDFSINTATLVPATEDVPEHCAVTGQILPQVRFEVRLPTTWNERFLMVGNGGYAGSISRGALAQGVREGFVTAGTDTGHDAATEPLGTFATDRQKLIDYAHRAVHVTTMTAKSIIEAYYEQPLEYSYFNGCSTGGRQALMAAQRFPADFDGILAGAPVLDFTGTMLWYIWMARALGTTPPDLQLLAERVYAACDALDGLADGLIDDPRRCEFDPARDVPLCQAGRGAGSCYTEEQIEALQTVYADVVAGDERVFPGLPFGAEVFVETPRGSFSGWERWIVNSLEPEPTIGVMFAETFLRYMAFRTPDPEYDWETLDFRQDPARMTWIRSVLDATDPDLARFRETGGKMLMYFGWADPALNPMMGVEYYEAVLHQMGPSVPEFFRLFMVPGMFHCGGGVGVNRMNWLEPLTTWVEQGTPPSHIVGSRVADGEVVRTRPLCPYPEVATYGGAGSIDDASNFECRSEGT